MSFEQLDTDKGQGLNPNHKIREFSGLVLYYGMK